MICPNGLLGPCGAIECTDCNPPPAAILSFPTQKAGDAAAIGSVTVRDLFAGFALMGILSRGASDVEIELRLWSAGEKDRRFERIAQVAGAIADVMVKERA